MPALYTHYYFGQEVLQELEKKDNKIAKEIKENINYYNIFNQGFDNLYYYLFKWTKYRTFGIRCHKRNIPLFFKAVINLYNLSDLVNHEEDNSILTNMVYGFINHYTLDTIIHPFINYQTDNLNIPHTKMEFMIDGYLYKQDHLKWHNNIYKTLIPVLKFPTNLNNLINYTFLNTYKEDNIAPIFNKSHNFGYFIYRYFINDNTGIKTFFYKFFDLFLIKQNFKFSQNTFNIKVWDNNILNNEHNKWHYPDRKEKIYKYSFLELYDISFKKCVKLNKLAYLVIHDKEDINKLLEEIENISIYD